MQTYEYSTHTNCTMILPPHKYIHSLKQEMLHSWMWSSPWWWDRSELGTPATLQSPREEIWWLWWPQRKCQQTSSFPSGRDRSGSEPPVLQATHGSPTYAHAYRHTHRWHGRKHRGRAYIHYKHNRYVHNAHTYVCMYSTYNTTYIRTYTYIHTYVQYVRTYMHAYQGVYTTSYVRMYVRMHMAYTTRFRTTQRGACTYVRTYVLA